MMPGMDTVQDLSPDFIEHFLAPLLLFLIDIICSFIQINST